MKKLIKQVILDWNKNNMWMDAMGTTWYNTLDRRQVNTLTDALLESINEEYEVEDE